MSVMQENRKPFQKGSRDKCRAMMAVRRAQNEQNEGACPVSKREAKLNNFSTTFCIDRANFTKRGEGVGMRPIHGRSGVVRMASRFILSPVRAAWQSAMMLLEAREARGKKRLNRHGMGAWNDMVTKELKKRWMARDTDMKIRADELQLAKEKWCEEKMDRELQFKQNKVSLALFSTLISKRTETR